ncbi:MAG: STAS domain-containing protein [Nitrospiria bacterium]
MDRPLITQGFRTEIQEVPGRHDVSKLVVQGRITYHEAPEFREIIFGEVSSTRLTALVVELGGVKHIDTAGLAVLVEGLLASRQRNLRMLLCQPSESVLQIFRLAGLRDALEASCTRPGEVERRLMG